MGFIICMEMQSPCNPYIFQNLIKKKIKRLFSSDEFSHKSKLDTNGGGEKMCDISMEEVRDILE